MFGELINEVKISFLLHTKSPLSIHSTNTKLLNPTLPDMQCVRSRYQGVDVPIIPGSSLKGVMRTRYEQIVRILGGSCCNIFENRDKKEKSSDERSQSEQGRGRLVYENACPVCKLFGDTSIASRIAIADAYPVGDIVIGKRTGVAINRITGAAQKGGLFESEVVEEGSFQVNICLKNYELYQLILILHVLKDMDDGYVALGAAVTRGNGRMEVKDLVFQFREYRKSVENLKGALRDEEIDFKEGYHFQYQQNQRFFKEAELETITLDEFLDECESIDLENILQKEERRNVHKDV